MQLPTNEVAIQELIKDKLNIIEPQQSEQYELIDNKPTSFVEMVNLGRQEKGTGSQHK